MFKQISLCITFFSICITHTLTASEYREFTNPEGRSIHAKILDYQGTNTVSIETREGQKFNDVPLSRFSSQDIAYIKEWAKEQEAAKHDAILQHDSKIQVFIKRSRDTDLNDKGDPDNQEEAFEPAITFDNNDKDLSFQNVKGTLVFIGQSVLNKKEYHIIYKEDFNVDLLSRNRTRWQGKPFINTYDSYGGNGSAFGAKYEGYLLVLRDKNGKAKIIKASKSRWTDVYKSILDADMNGAYNRNFDERFAKTKI